MYTKQCGEYELASKLSYSPRPLARAFSRGSLCLPKKESLLAGKENMHINIRVLRLMILLLQYINSVFEGRTYVTKRKDRIFEY